MKLKISFCFEFLWIPSNAGRQNWKGPFFRVQSDELTVCFIIFFHLQPSLGIAPKRALAIETAEQQAAMKKIKEMQSNRGELIKKEQENFKVFNQKVQAKNAAIVAANPEAATSGSVIASDRLMKELRTIHKSRLFKNGDYHVRIQFYYISYLSRIV